ncbi:hypothetical protein [Thiomicrorhabdus arctica]|uniref:hypothetical protein n=1 Tax=Thiomicrorhabdus arctica TaxID=131540 RepID=UPI0003738C46|nr:hypothetical protein [Thiomicrorhabdus arctica]
MKNNTLLISALTSLFILVQSSIVCASDVVDGSSKGDTQQIKVAKNMNKRAALTVLDEVLSPFEDMAEYALDKNLLGMKKGYKKIELIQDNGLLKQTVSDQALKSIDQNIEKLEGVINRGDFAQVALLSAQMFGESISSFKHVQKITNQLYIEHLDEMGFRLLALIEANQTDSKIMLNIIIQAKANWLALKGQLNDENKVESFDLLFKGLEQSVSTNDLNMVQILASMDLSLVDIIEKDFQ